MTAGTRLKTVRDINPEGRTLFVRADLNVPFHPGTTKISDDSRIKASLPTIKHLLNRQNKIVICSHLGRPKGKVVDTLRMTPITQRLTELLDCPVTQTQDCIGTDVKEVVGSMKPRQVTVLENVRFHFEEEINDPIFAKSLASLADIYVNDAFGAAHRAHASTEGISKFIPSVAGLLMAREINILGQLLDSPKRPFSAVLGGAKVSDKISMLENMLNTVDVFIIGGGMAATFLKAMDYPVGNSTVEQDHIQFARSFINECIDSSTQLLLPIDVVIANCFSSGAQYRTVGVSDVPDGWQIMDIGPQTQQSFNEAIKESLTVLWNGPMGVFEWDSFNSGTKNIAHSISDLEKATTVVGGGSTVEAVGRFKVADKITHISTGGGASLEFLEGKVLPGYAALLEHREEI